MEDINIDQVVDVPDTPDRLAALGGQERSLSVTGHSRGSAFNKEESLRGRDKSVMENGQRRRLYFRSRRNVSNAQENECRGAPLEISYPSQKAQSSRRMEIGKNIEYENRSLIGAQDMDKRKLVHSKFVSKSPASREDNAVTDLTEMSTKTEIPETARLFGASQNLLAEEIRKGKTATNVSSLHRVPPLSNTSTRSWKGKEKADSNTHEGAGSAIDSGTGIVLSYDSQHQTEKRLPTFLHSVASPRVAGQKRLVRNGCISPHNIARRAKQSSESHSQSSKYVEHNHTLDMVSNGLPCLSDISEIVAKENRCDRGKGKGLVSHPSTSNEHDKRIIQIPSSRIINKVEADRTTDAGGDAYRHVEGLAGWRSTRTRNRNIGRPSSDVAGHLSRRNDASNRQYENKVEIIDDSSGENFRAECGFPADRSSAQVQASRNLSNLEKILPQASDAVPKRQRTRGTTLRNHGECSTSVPDNSDIVCLGSSRESPNSRFARQPSSFGFFGPHNHQNQLIEIDELLPEVRRSGSHGTNNDDSDSKAIQLQADEMLARELQEQLYNEVPVVGGGETDEHIALALQQEEAALRGSSGHRFRISLPEIHSSSQPMSRSIRRPSNRRGTHARVPTSTRTTRLRDHIPRRSSAVLSRQRRLQFPEGMDMDMRLDILEALEAALGDIGDALGDIGDMRMGGHVLQVQRDFNENDYEMLLALDENNHRVGASVNQINGLPLSTVQTENLEEACAVCLETPTIGDTIRHLPCLHKFHKDCIDPWLSRSTSCPVCKSSVT